MSCHDSLQQLITGFGYMKISLASYLRVVLQVPKDTVISTELASLIGLSNLASIRTKNSQVCESRRILLVWLLPPTVLPAITVYVVLVPPYSTWLPGCLVLRQFSHAVPPTVSDWQALLSQRIWNPQLNYELRFSFAVTSKFACVFPKNVYLRHSLRDWKVEYCLQKTRKQLAI